MILIGNKSDLEEKRCISKEQGEECTKNICGEVNFYETSCKTGENIEEAFNDLAGQIYNKFSGNNLEEKDNINIKKVKTSKKKGNSVNNRWVMRNYSTKQPLNFELY